MQGTLRAGKGLDEEKLADQVEDRQVLTYFIIVLSLAFFFLLIRIGFEKFVVNLLADFRNHLITTLFVGFGTIAMHVFVYSQTPDKKSFADTYFLVMSIPNFLLIYSIFTGFDALIEVITQNISKLFSKLFK